MFVLFTYFIFQLRKGKGSQWWILVITTTIWTAYLLIWALIDPITDFINFYHGWIPYQFPLILYINIPGGILSTLIFYFLGKKTKSKENE